MNYIINSEGFQLYTVTREGEYYVLTSLASDAVFRLNNKTYLRTLSVNNWKHIEPGKQREFKFE